MSFDLISIMSIFTVISVIITGVILLSTVSEVSNAKQDKPTVENEDALTDYARILKVTRKIETEREKDLGEYSDYESVYLSRARLIREKSSLFSWIK